MVNLNKSFIYGICFASLTWAISLYLYWQLNRNFSNNPNTLTNTNNYQNSPQLIKQLQPIATKNKSDQTLNQLGMVKSLSDQEIRDEGYKLHAFNVLVSNKLSLHRRLPDTRNKLCRDVKYTDDLPKTSIIICFYNEHYETLLRTLHSIVDRTPSNLLQEIILIDDYSDIPNLNSQITKYLFYNHLTDKIKLYRTERREGLIRARMYGVKRSSGEVLLFLDSHVEVNVDWIQPLLTRIKQNSTYVAIPIIDIINADTFAYSASPLVRGGFNWGLHYKWENLPVGTLATNEDFIKPLKTPTMAGGLFAIDRKYFTHLGEYDAGMDIWGGENLEMSFRLWMCGGRMDIIPCSRVGHVFRHRRPYGDPDGKDTMLRNSLRVANVWLDDYKDNFLKQRSDAKGVNYGDVTSRIELRKRLKCYDFDWYIKNVYPELTLPSDNDQRLKNKWSALEHDKYQPWHSRKRNYIDQYQIRLSGTTLCIQTSKDVKTKGSSIVLKPCSRKKNQMWYETDKKELVLAQLLCLQSSKASPYLYKCHEMGGDQEWNHTGQAKTPIYNMAAGTCLGVDETKVGATVQLKMCADTKFNSWDLIR